MNYNDVLADLFDLLEKHKMIKSWGYGPLSELVEPKSGNETNYPYAFLQPTNHTLSTGQKTYRFNLIMMEMCNDTQDEVIQAQSNCEQYIQDVLAHIYYHYDKYDFKLNVSLVPFQEKYDDTVSGMTAQMELIVPNILNDCISPFEPTAPISEGELVATLYSKTDSVNYEHPISNFGSLNFDDKDREWYNPTYFEWKNVSDNEFRLEVGEYNFVLSGEMMTKDTDLYVVPTGYQDGNYATIVANPDWSKYPQYSPGLTIQNPELIATGFDWTYGFSTWSGSNGWFIMMRIPTNDIPYATMYSNLKLEIYKTA